MKLLKHELSTELIIIRYLNKYLPKSRYDVQDDFSKSIIGLKNKDNNFINYFFRILKSKIAKNPNTVICVVPSSTIAKRSSGIRELSIKLKDHCNLSMGLQIIQRGTDVTPQHERIGRSSYEEQYNSLYLIDVNLTKNKNILLLDDIITSGNTLLACSNLLLKHGAKKIICLVLGRTIESVKV